MQSFTLTTRQFHDLFRPLVGYAAGKESYAPVLEGVHIKGLANGLMAEATDRYRLGRQTLKGVEGTDGFEALIHVSAIRRALATFRIKGPLPGRGEVTIERVDEKPENSTWEPSVIMTGDTGDRWTPTAQFTFGNIAGDFPKLDALFTSHFERADPKVAFNPNYLSDLAKSAPDGRLPILTGAVDPNKPATFRQYTELYEFKALLMPVKFPGDES